MRAWWGGLVDGMRDASGQMYMRNRYYDPPPHRVHKTYSMDPMQVVRELVDECHEDYVGLWRLTRTLPDGANRTERVDLIVSMVTALLRTGTIRLGQFHQNEFHPWTGTEREQLERIRLELKALGRDPDIGEIAWLTAI